MKKLISMSLLLLFSCGPSNEELDAIEKRKKDSMQQILIDEVSKEKEQLNAIDLENKYSSDKDFVVRIYKIKDCEYINFRNDKLETIQIIHSESCSNPIHNIKENTNH